MGSWMSAIGAKNLGILRVLRILRIVRVVRIIRVFRFFRELRLMVLSIMSSTKALAWVVILLSTITYMVAIFFVEEASAHRVTHQDDIELNKQLKEFFGSILAGMYTLFLCFSGGINWGE